MVGRAPHPSRSSGASGCSVGVPAWPTTRMARSGEPLSPGDPIGPSASLSEKPDRINARSRPSGLASGLPNRSTRVCTFGGQGSGLAVGHCGRLRSGSCGGRFCTLAPPGTKSSYVVVWQRFTWKTPAHAMDGGVSPVAAPAPQARPDVPWTPPGRSLVGAGREPDLWGLSRQPTSVPPGNTRHVHELGWGHLAARPVPTLDL